MGKFNPPIGRSSGNGMAGHKHVGLYLASHAKIKPAERSGAAAFCRVPQDQLRSTTASASTE